MTQETLFRIMTATLFCTALGIGIYFRRKAEKEGGQLDRSGTKVLVGLRVGGLIAISPLMAYLIHPAWAEWAQLDLPVGVRWAAVGMAVLILPAIVWLYTHIGRNISPSHTTRQGHKLITTGPYRYIRHPLYTFGLLYFSAISLISGLWWLMVGLGILMVALVWRTAHEEANLVAKFGDEYRTYMHQTGRFLPKLGGGR